MADAPRPSKPLHQFTTEDGIAIVARWSVADAAGRAALTTSSWPAVAIGGVCFQRDSKTFWICTQVTPSITWQQLGSGGGGGGDVPSTRTIAAGAGLQGGGSLAADRTLAVKPNADGSIVADTDGTKVGVLATDAQHGTRGRGNLHTTATSSEDGFLKASDKVAYDAAVAALPNKADASSVTTALAAKADQTYVDQLLQGLDAKGSVDAVATTNITLSGLQTVDGKALTAGMLCLAAGQTDATQNGPYTVSASAWSRAPNANTSAKVTAGLYVWTSNGANKGGWLLTTPDPITLGTTALTFERYEIGLSNTTPLVNGTATAGSDALAARGTHVHPTDTSRAAAAQQVIAGNGLQGGGTLAADRTLSVKPNADGSIVADTNGTAVGVISDAQHGTRGGGTTHAVATKSAAGFMSTTQAAQVDLLYTLSQQTKTETRARSLRGSSNTSKFGSVLNASNLPYSYAVTQSGFTGGTVNQVSDDSWTVDLTDDMPLNATAFRMLTLTLTGASSSTAVPTNEDRPAMQLMQVDPTGLATIVAGPVWDTSANLTAYKASHTLVWNGSVAVRPDCRYIAVLQGAGTSAGGSGAGLQFTGLRASIDYVDSFDALINAMSPFDWYRADSVNLSGSNVASLKNRAQGATNVATVSGTVAAPASDASFNGQPSLTLAGTQSAVSTRPASDYTFLQQQFDVFHVFLQTSAPSFSILHATGSTGNNWAQMYTSSDGSVQNNLFGTGAAGSTSVNTVANFDAGLNVPRAVEGSFSAATNVAISNNLGQGAGPTDIVSPFAPSSTTPSNTLTMWVRPGGSLGLYGRWCETIIFPRVLSALERQLVREYIQARYGIVAPVVPAAAKRILARAPKSFVCGDSPVTLSSGNVSAIHDLARHGAAFTQATGAAQVPAPVAVSGLYNGRPVFTTNGKGYSSSLPAAEWAFEADGSGCDEFTVARATSLTGSRTLAATTSVASAQGMIKQSNGNASVYFNFYKPAGAVGSVTSNAGAVNVPFVLRTRHASSSSPNMAAKLTGTTEVTANYGTSVGSGAPAYSKTIFWQNGGNSWIGDIACMVDFARVLTAQEAADTYADLLELYGVAA